MLVKKTLMRMIIMYCGSNIQIANHMNMLSVTFHEEIKVRVDPVGVVVVLEYL